MAIRRLGPEDRFLNIKEVRERTTESESTIKRKIKDPDSDFPRPVQISEARRGWLLSDVLDYIERRVNASKAA